jgi:hypothetical protein
MKMIFKFLLIYYLSIFVRSININVTNFEKINIRLRNTSLRFVVFNKFYKKFRENLVFFISPKKSNTVLDENNSYLLNNYYNICYRYYSLSEDDAINLEFILSLLF